LAERANNSAGRLARGLAAISGVRIAWPTEVNEVFVVAPDALVAQWRAAGARLHEWTTRSLARENAPRTGEALVRLVTSFETASAEIDRLIGVSAHGLVPIPAATP
jgi:threonine aldolase